MRWGILLLALLAGCVDLRTVRDFADESARFPAYTDLTVRFRDTFRREEPYLWGEALDAARANDRSRQAACRDLLEIHRTLVAYLRSLSALAGEGAFDVSEGLGEAASRIRAHAGYGLEARHAAACASLARVAARRTASARQARAVRDLVREADPSVQQVLEGMAAAVACIRRANENERDTVAGLLSVEIPYADAAQDRLLAALAKAHLQARLEEYRAADAMGGKAERWIRKIQEGHRTLAEGADRLSRAEAKAWLAQCTQDLKALRSGLRSLGRNVE